MLRAAGLNDAGSAQVTPGQAAASPLSVQRGGCGVTVMPRDRVIVTGGSGFLVLTGQQAADLTQALVQVMQELHAAGGARS